MFNTANNLVGFLLTWKLIHELRMMLNNSGGNLHLMMRSKYLD